MPLMLDCKNNTFICTLRKCVIDISLFHKLLTNNVKRLSFDYVLPKDLMYPELTLYKVLEIISNERP